MEQKRRVVGYRARRIDMTRSLPALLLLASALAACARAIPATDPQAATQGPSSEVALGTDAVSSSAASPKESDMAGKTEKIEKVVRTDEEWRKILTPEQYRILREKDTERAFTGKYWDTKTKGIYKCAGCGLPLFASDTKFDSGCGWPSFFEPLVGARLVETEDRTHGMIRTEITCAACGGHMGHVFDDGPDPTGLRYCINSASITLVPEAGARPATEAKKPTK
jgi:peptide-methionine (R)-S-oxide reductase